MKSKYFESDESVEQESSGDFNLRAWIYRLLRLWPVFLLSFAVCLVLAYLYLHYTTPTYSSIASVMVKDEKKGAQLMDNSMLENIGLGGNNKLVENEIEILKSYDLVDSVVYKLQLFVSIQKVGRIRDVEMYEDLPFRFEVLNPANFKKAKSWKLIEKNARLSLVYNAGDAPVYLDYNKVYLCGGIMFRVVRDFYSSAVESKDAEYNVNISLPATATETYIDKLNVNAANKVATVINLELKDNNRRKATRILESIISIYNHRGLDDKNRVSDNTVDFLNRRLYAVENGLQETEGSVEQFKRANRVTELSADAQQFMAASAEVDMQKAQSQTQLNIVNALEDELKDQTNMSLVPSTLGIQEPALGALIARHNELLLQQQRLEATAGPKNPLLLDLNDQVRDLRARLLSNVRSLKQAYQITVADVSKKDAQISGRIGSVPSMERKLVQITRNQTVQEQLYAFLLQKKEEAEITRASNLEDSRTIVRARTLGEIAPKRKMVWGIAILLALVLPIGFILIRDSFNNRIGDEAEVEKNSQVAMIGKIAHVKNKKGAFVINPKSRTAVAEQIRNIRTAIGFTGKGKDVKTILITSYQPGDGKSFFSLNLAASYALLEKKTVVLEFDLRRPQITKDLGITVKAGLSNYLSGKSPINELLVPLEGYENNLFLLPAGYLPPNPAELISGAKMKQLIAELSERFDIIIIDTPPFSLVTDANLLQTFADLSLVVVRQDHTAKSVYKELNTKVRTEPNNPVYLVLNDVGKLKRYDKNAYTSGYNSYYTEEE